MNDCKCTSKGELHIDSEQILSKISKKTFTHMQFLSAYIIRSHSAFHYRKILMNLHMLMKNPVQIKIGG